MPDTQDILLRVEDFVSGYLKERISGKLKFHNYSHTKEVVFAAREIASHCGLSAERLNIVEIAAWFHDCGYSTTYTGHENESAQVARTFLTRQSYPQEMLEVVVECIEATRYPQNPGSLEAKIVCDADLYHFARPDYERHEKALRDEWEAYLGMVFTDQEWIEKNCRLLFNHQYFTSYGQGVLQQFKQVNINRLNCRLG